MRVFKFRALLTLDAPEAGQDARQYPSGTHALLIHVHHVGDRPCDKCLPAVISRDTGMPLLQGERSVVTLTVADDDALAYLAARPVVYDLGRLRWSRAHLPPGLHRRRAKLIPGCQKSAGEVRPPHHKMERCASHSRLRRA